MTSCRQENFEVATNLLKTQVITNYPPFRDVSSPTSKFSTQSQSSQFGFLSEWSFTIFSNFQANKYINQHQFLFYSKKLTLEFRNWCFIKREYKLRREVWFGGENSQNSLNGGNCMINLNSPENIIIQAENLVLTAAHCCKGGVTDSKIVRAPAQSQIVD